MRGQPFHDPPPRGGELPGCVQDEERGWLIPVEALLAAGFRLNAPAPPEDAVPAGSTVPAAGLAAAGTVGEDIAALWALADLPGRIAVEERARRPATSCDGRGILPKRAVGEMGQSRPTRSANHRPVAARGAALMNAPRGIPATAPTRAVRVSTSV